MVLHKESSMQSLRLIHSLGFMLYHQELPVKTMEKHSIFSWS